MLYNVFEKETNNNLMSEVTQPQEISAEDMHKIVLVDSSTTNLTLLEGMLRRLDGVESISFTDPPRSP